MNGNPNSRTTLEVLKNAGEKGLTAREIAEQFPDAHPRAALSDVNLYLARAHQAGRVKRSAQKERTFSPAGRPSKSFRWFITGAGVEYLVPVPLPAVTQLAEPPSARRVLELLKEAGEEGMLAGAMARHFTIPDPHMPSQAARMSQASQNLQRRQAWTNQFLDRFLRHGWARRGPSEASPYYHGVPVYRWFITGEGVAYLAGGMDEGVRLRRVAEAALVAAERRAARKRADDVITQAYVDFDPLSTYKCEREKAIRELRDAGCTLAEIGGVFGLTRERVRQILAGYKTSRCTCPSCAGGEWFEVGDGETV